MSIFKELAQPEDRAVPTVRKRSVMAEREGEVVVLGKSRAGTGYRPYAVVVESTTKKDSRGFVSAR